MFPYTSTIKAGGSVTFNISGTHLILVYSPGTTLESINGSLIEGVDPPFPGFVNDPVNRIYADSTRAPTRPIALRPSPSPLPARISSSAASCRTSSKACTVS